MQINKYFISALTAFILWGFFSLALKPLASYPSLDILFFRVFIATVILLIINSSNLYQETVFTNLSKPIQAYSSLLLLNASMIPGKSVTQAAIGMNSQRSTRVTPIEQLPTSVGERSRSMKKKDMRWSSKTTKAARK